MEVKAPVVQAAPVKEEKFVFFDDKDFDDFISWSDEQLKEIEFSPSYKVDFIYSASNVSSKDILELGDAKYLWG